MASHNREPVKHSCPEIDGYIKSIKRALTEERYLKSLGTCYHAEGYVLRLRAFRFAKIFKRKMHGNVSAVCREQCEALRRDIQLYAYDIQFISG